MKEFIKSNAPRFSARRMFNDDEIVSADIIGNPHSGIVDAPSTMVVMNRVAKVLVWYDNEFGYARRMLDLAAYISDR